MKAFFLLFSFFFFKPLNIIKKKKNFSLTKEHVIPFSRCHVSKTEPLQRISMAEKLYSG